MNIVGPLISKEGKNYRAFATTINFDRNDDLSVYLNCSGEITTKKKIWPMSDLMSQIIDLEVSKNSNLRLKISC